MHFCGLGAAAVEEPHGVIADRQNVILPYPCEARNKRFQEEAIPNDHSRWQAPGNKEGVKAAACTEDDQALLGAMPQASGQDGL